MKAEWLSWFFNIAHAVASKSRCQRAQVGCLLVRDKKIVAVGYNGVMRGSAKHCDDSGCVLDHTNSHCISVHAEQNCIATAAQLGVSTEGATAFVTLEPCIRCAQILVNAGIRAVYFDKYYKEEGRETIVASPFGREFSDPVLANLLYNSKYVDIWSFWNYVNPERLDLTS